MTKLINKEERAEYGIKVSVDTSDLEHALDVAIELKETLEKCVELRKAERWLPADQLTPAHEGTYWITVRSGRFGRKVMKGYFSIEWEVDDEVLAWMPDDKPEAYKGGTDDEHPESC